MSEPIEPPKLIRDLGPALLSRGALMFSRELRSRVLSRPAVELREARAAVTLAAALAAGGGEADFLNIRVALSATAPAAGQCVLARALATLSFTRRARVTSPTLFEVEPAADVEASHTDG